MAEKAKKMRILAAAEIEGDSKIARRLAEKAAREKVDLVVLCGDITGMLDSKNIIKPFKDKHQKVLLIPGNHDSFATADFLANLYGVRNIHGYSVKYDNIGFFGAGGALEVGPESRVTEKELTETLEKAHAGLKDVQKTIMVTHMHPAGSASEFSGIEGSKAIRRAVLKFKPAFLLHGHIHEAGGIEEKIGNTRVINVGREGKVLEI